MKSTIRLFKAVPITVKKKKKASKDLIKSTILRGFIFSPEVIANYSESKLQNFIDIIEEEIGLTPEKLNQTFHKSWNKVKTAPMEQLIIEQLIHYFTTYGFESLGIYNKESVYIPVEKLEIPELKEGGINITIIRGYTKKELKEKILDLLSSGIALKAETIEDVFEVCEFVKINEKDLAKIKNKEVKIKLYDELKIVPENPIEFLRYMIYKTTGKTLIIKNVQTEEEIKDSMNSDSNTLGKININSNNVVIDMFAKYQKQYGLKKLAEIFYRFKPLFLAFKKNDKLKPIINKIRRMAPTYHKPMEEDYLNNITSKLKNKHTIIVSMLKEELEKVNTFRKIRLAYALNFRTGYSDGILYRIRNGKSYAKEFNFSEQKRVKKILDIVLNSIVEDIKKNVKGKKIYLPEVISYTLPATEKQFTGNIPSGSYVIVKKDMIFGIHWENLDTCRVDLDLSLINVGGKIGWDSSYRNDEETILFSGDITDAPKPRGATELFYVRRQSKEAHLLLNNYYNYEDNRDKIDVPFKIIIGQEQVSNLKQNYMINPNNVKIIVPSIINVKQKILGLLVTTRNECRYYFTETGLGSFRTSFNKDYVEWAKNYLFNYYENSIKLSDILKKAGAKIVDDIKKCDINLSPEALEKDTILNLIKSNK